MYKPFRQSLNKNKIQNKMSLAIALWQKISQLCQHSNKSIFPGGGGGGGAGAGAGGGGPPAQETFLITVVT
jgi:uncharacterized membrane protein